MKKSNSVPKRVKMACEIALIILYTFLFCKSLSHDPNVNLSLARYYVNLRQDCTTAVELLRPEIAAYPDDVEFHITLAQCYMKLGALKNAVLHLEKVLSLQPDNTHVLQILKTIKHDER